MAEQILKHVEQLEYLKEVARMAVSKMIDGENVRDLIDDPAADAERILSRLLPLLPFSDVAKETRDYARWLGLQVEDEEATVKEQEDHFLLVLLPPLTATLTALRSRVDNMAAGASPETLATALDTVAVRQALLAPLESLLRQSVGTGVQEMSRALMAKAADFFYGKTDVLEWVAILDGSTCDDQFENSCAPRHGESLSLGEWDDAGRPGAPMLICSIYAKAGSNCRCALRVDTSVPIPSPVLITDAVKAGKERAQAQA